MRTSYHSVSSARRLSSWLAVVLGLAAYVGSIYGLTMLPLQFEVPLPHWGTFAVPPVVYGLLVLLFVRRPSVLRWLVGTAILSGLHLLLGVAREPLTALLDPALAGRPLPWMLPPPLPELVGVILLLVPLRDVLRARPRPARERGSSAGRPSPSPRGRGVVAPRPQPAAPAESAGSLSEALLSLRIEPSPGPVVAAAPMVAPAPVPPAPPAPPPQDPRRRRAAARAERTQEAEIARPTRRSDVVLRIALDRIMGQLPPGTFLAPEDEMAASLRDPGYLLIPGELVVTQLSEGIAQVAWSDIVDQFPSHLVGLGSAEISEHLGDGLKLPLDAVVSQMPHELFVSDTPEVPMPGLERIPVPFHPLEESGPAPSRLREAAPEIRPAPPVERPRVISPAPAPAPQVVEAAVETLPAVSPEPVAVVPPAAPPRVAEPARSAPEPIRMPEPSPAGVAALSGEIGEPTVRISFGRVASEIPAEVFRVPLERVAEQMRQPGSLLIPQSLVVPQLAEGLIQVSWEVVAAQFPRDQMTVSDAEMVERLPNGIRLPLDEVIRQVPPDLFMTGGPAVDVRGLESFPAPFQPLVSDPAPAPPPAEAPAAVVDPEPAPVAGVVELVEREAVAVTGVAAEDIPAPSAMAEPAPSIEVTAPAIVETDLDGRLVRPAPGLDAVAAMPEPMSEPVVGAEPTGVETERLPAPILASPSRRAVEPAIANDPGAWPDMTAPRAPIPVPAAAGSAETAEARRIAALLAPIASFDASVQVMEGVTVFAMAAPTVAPETAVAVAGLALPLLTDRRAPWSVDQITLRGPETALVLTPLGGRSDRGPVLAVAAPRGGALALLEILCRRAQGDRGRGTAAPAPDTVSVAGRRLVPAALPARAAGLTSSMTAFGAVSASVLRDAEGEGVLYFFLPSGGDAPAVAAFAQDLQTVMRKAAGSGALFRTAVLRCGNTFLVIQPEEIGHGRSIVVVAGGEVTRPGLAYRQVERATAMLVQA
jgi:hypothetical protein